MLAGFKPFMGTISDKVGRRLIINIGLLIGGIVSILMPLTTNYIWLILILCFFGVGMAMVISSTTAYVSDYSKVEDYGTSIGILSTIMDIGQTLGPIISGYILVAFSFGGVFWMVGFVLLASCIMFIFV